MTITDKAGSNSGNQPPKAGETRSSLGSESRFIAPLPLPTGQPAFDTDCWICNVDEVNLELSQRSGDVVWSIQSIIWLVMTVLAFFISIPVVTYFWSLSSHELETAFSKSMELFKLGLAIFSVFIIFVWIAAVHPILRATWDKAYNQPVRFNRQRREICYVPEGSDKPLYQPWESMVVWYNTGVVATGHAVMTHYQFGFAIDDPRTNVVHPLNLPVSSAHHALGLWESIRRFMEHGPDHCPKPLPPQGSNTLDEERAEIHRLYRIGHKSGFQLFLWYVWRIYTWWRVPYWVAEWDKNYAYRYLLPEVEAWSAPLPPEQWAQPSEQLRHESARIRYAMSHGHSWLDYLQGKVSVPATLPEQYYDEIGTDQAATSRPQPTPVSRPPGGKRRGKKAAALKRQAKEQAEG